MKNEKNVKYLFVSILFLRYILTNFKLNIYSFYIQIFVLLKIYD